jgi:hypothetical protein
LTGGRQGKDLVNWDIVGATGEWAGAIAVVASLLYLARQIQQATRQARAAARYSFVDAYGETNAAIFQSTDTASIYRRGLAGELTEPDEQMQFTLMLANFINTWNVLYDLHEEDQLPDTQWELVCKDIHALYSTPGGRRFWEETGRHAMNQRFVEAVEHILGGESEAYTFVPPSR